MTEVPCMVLGSFLYIYDSVVSRDAAVRSNRAYVRDVEKWGYQVDPRWVAPVIEACALSLERLKTGDYAPHEITYADADGGGKDPWKELHYVAKPVVDTYLATLSPEAQAREAEWQAHLRSIWGDWSQYA